MDRKFSHSVPYLPRYHSVSPARSPRLDSRRYTSVRSLSQPSQRIFYIDNAPSRVINSYAVHHSPSPHRSYSVRLISLTKNNHLSRQSRSLSAHDLNSSHVYVSEEELFDKSIKEAAARHVGSCDDIYHKAPFFPDITPSESGVSVGESEEGSLFGGEDDNLSQHSLESAGAFYELTADNELDRCDSGHDTFGDRTLDILYEDDLDENQDRKARSRPKAPQSPDSHSVSPLSYADRRRRELMSSPSSDFDKTQSRLQALKIHIPGHESSGRAGKESSRAGEKKAAAPLAQSTPHVSPRGTGEPRFYVTASWNADDPYNELSGHSEPGKSKAARALFDLDLSDTDCRHQSRPEDSSYNSSCSEDNFSDISNATISSPVPRKTKLVKKSSDRPTSSKSYNMQGFSAQTRNASSELASSGKTSLSSIDTSGYVGSDYSESITTSHLATSDTDQDGQTLAKLSPHGLSSGRRGEQDEWCTVYNIGAASERHARDTTCSPETEGDSANYRQKIHIVKPLKVNIPLITAGKQGQEKLRKMSQTSPPLTGTRSPTLLSGDTPRSPGLGQKEGMAEARNANMGHFGGQFGEREAGKLKQFDPHAYRTCGVDENQEEKQEERDRETVRNLSPTPRGVSQNMAAQGERESEVLVSEGGGTSQHELSFKSLMWMHDSKIKDESEESDMEISEGECAREQFVEGLEVDSLSEIDSLHCTRDSGPAQQTAISALQAERLDNYQVSDSTQQASGQFMKGPSGARLGEGMTQVTACDGTVSHVHQRSATSEERSQASDGGNDRSHGHSPHYGLGNGQETVGLARGTQDKFSTSVISPTLPAINAQVSSKQGEGEGPEGEAGAKSAGEVIHFGTGTSGKQESGASQRERASTDVNSSAVLCQESASYGINKTGASERDTCTVRNGSDNSAVFEQLLKFDGELISDDVTDQLVKSEGSETTGNFYNDQLRKLDTSWPPADTVVDLDIHDLISVGVGQLTEQGLSVSDRDCHQTIACVDPVTSGEEEDSTDMPQSIDPRPTSWGVHCGAAECRDTPQTQLRVVATAQRSGNNDINSVIIKNNSNNVSEQGRKSAFSTPQSTIRGTAAPSGIFFATPVQGSSDVYQHHANVIDSSEQVRHGSPHQSPFSFDSGFDNENASSLGVSAVQAGSGWRQQEAHSSDFSTWPPPVVEQSIPEPVRGPRAAGDKGIHQDQRAFCAAKDGGAFVEGGEQPLPSHDEWGKPVTVTEVSSKHVKHIHRTTIEKIVTTEEKVNHSPSGVSSGYSDSGSGGVNVVSTKETIIKEDEDYVTTSTTNTLFSDGGPHADVSSKNDNQDLTDTNHNISVLSAPASAATPRGCGEFLSDPSSTSPSLVSTARSADSVGELPAYGMRGKRDTWDATDSGSALGQAWPSVPTAIINDNNSVTGGQGQARNTGLDTAESAMHHPNPLDNLQAQLSRISTDLSPASTGTQSQVTGSDVYHDHAEATSVLKEIVRGEVVDVTSSGGVSVSTLRKFTDYELLTDAITEDAAAGESNRVQSQEQGAREEYDNDYDYVTTDLHKPGKSSRPHHHIQLLKPGQLKASSLWTLQEETESIIDSLSPKPSPKRSSATEGDISNHQSSLPSPALDHIHGRAQWRADGRENEKGSRVLNSAFGQRTLASAESSDFDESDGNYSSISTTESSSYRSSSYGREQTPLSETESLPQAFSTDRMDYQEVEEIPPHTDIDRITSFHEFVSGVKTDSFSSTWDSNARDSMTGAQGHSSPRPVSKFGTSTPRGQLMPDRLATLDSLTASLQQFSSGSFESGLGDSHSFTLTKDSLSGLPGTTEDTLNVSNSTLQSWNEDTHSEASSRLHALDLDLSRISACTSPTPSDISDASMYTCKGTAEIKKLTVTFDQHIPSAPTSTIKLPKSPKTASKTKLKSALKRPSSESKQDELQKQKIEQFENLLNDFNKGTCPTADMPDVVIMEDKQRERTDGTNYSDLYKEFTNDTSEKQQNNVCIVVEDENMSTFRFKRFLKKSHTKRKKGKRVLRFLSRLGCVSESVSSPEASPNKKAKLSDREVPTYSTDSMPSSKHKISNPILISSTSFHHHELLHPTPDETPSSSNQSLDSLRSRADSAYSSISESASVPMNSPTSQRLSSSTLRVPPASTGSVSSSVFLSGSTSEDRSRADSAFSERSMPSFSGPFSESDTTFKLGSSISEHTAGPADVEMLSALSDVFDQLDVCEGEIDTAMLNTLRHGHTKANFPRK